MIKKPFSKGYFRYLPLAVFVIAIFLSTTISEEITAFAEEALKLCAKSVIPSLFPFMVFASFGCRAIISIYPVKSEGLSFILAFLLGALCGFPTGAAVSADLYKGGAVSKDLAEKMCAFCNNAGPAFVISVIGGNFWGNYRIGIIIYICQILSSVLVFMISQLIFGKKRKGADQDFCNCINSEISGSAHLNLSEIFCTSVSQSVSNMVNICGYIIFFKVICDFAGMLLDRTFLNNIINTALSSVLEFTTGSYNSANAGGGSGIFLCGFAVGFSGLSVIAQTSSVISKSGLSAAPMIKYKIIIGTVSGILSYIAYNVIPQANTVSAVVTLEGNTTMKYVCMGVIVSAVFVKLTSVLRHRLSLYIKNS